MPPDILLPTGVLLFGLALIILFKLLTGSGDEQRIRKWIESKGNTVRSIQPHPIGAEGWLGEEGERFYAVDYEDDQGVEHRATVKTDRLQGVWWTDVAPEGAADEESTAGNLSEENARLRAKLEALRRAKAQRGDADPVDERAVAEDPSPGRQTKSNYWS